MSITGNIDTLKATISKRTGLARSNRFAVYINLPIISINKDRILSNVLSGNINPLQAFNDPRDISLLCDSCTLPGRQITTLDRQTNMKTVKVANGYLNEDVTFSFMLTGDYFIKTVFESWSKEIINFEELTLKFKEDYVGDVIIQQLNERDVPIYSVRLNNAFPTTISSVELSNANENTISKVDITMSYDDWEEVSFIEELRDFDLQSRLDGINFIEVS
jgi:hypothetical protein